MTSTDQRRFSVLKLEPKRTSRRKTIIVTGGAGFLGSRLCARKLAAGHEVICIDNLQTGRMQNIATMMRERRFRFIEHDVIYPYNVNSDVDEIYNLACPASPPKYQIDPIHTFKTSVFGALHALELAKSKDAKVFQASTSEVYGDPTVSPQPEIYRGNVTTQGPRACYDEGKRAAETLFYDFNARYGVRTRIARIFNTYGPGMDPDDGRVVSNFIVQALLGKDLTIYGNGSQTRSFCYVDDLLDGIEALMAYDGDPVLPVNLGNPCEFTVLELAKEVLALIETGARTRFMDLPVDDPRQRRPDISRARAMLGWRPRVELRQGLVKTVDYFRAELDLAEETLLGVNA